jgi:hypothetical protein
MSDKALKALQDARREALQKQQVCAWCDKVCSNADHLVAHILLRHEGNNQLVK